MEGKERGEKSRRNRRSARSQSFFGLSCKAVPAARPRKMGGPVFGVGATELMLVERGLGCFGRANGGWGYGPGSIGHPPAARYFV